MHREELRPVLLETSLVRASVYTGTPRSTLGLVRVRVERLRLEGCPAQIIRRRSPVLSRVHARARSLTLSHFIQKNVFFWGFFGVSLGRSTAELHGRAR